nr:MAG TPA: hypothetical protein [Caudoviricetes sp.]
MQFSSIYFSYLSSLVITTPLSLFFIKHYKMM